MPRSPWGRKRRPDLSPGRFSGLITVLLAFGIAVAAGYVLAPEHYGIQASNEDGPSYAAGGFLASPSGRACAG